MRIRRSSILLAVLAACSSDSTSPQPTGTSSPLVTISAGASSVHQQEVTMIQSKTGRIVAAWIGFLDQSNASVATIEYAISNDAGQTWGHPSAVILPAGFANLNDPALAVDSSGTVTLAALAFGPAPIGEHSGVFVYSLATGASAFSSPAVVDSLAATAQALDKPQVAVTDAGMLVTYSVISSTPVVGFAATSVDGINWQHDTVDTNHPQLIALCAAGSSVTAVYFRATGGTWTTSSTTGGRTWAAPYEIDPLAVSSTYPACVQHGSDEWVLYGTAGAEFALAHSADRGAHFSLVPTGISGSEEVGGIAVRSDGTLDIAYYTVQAGPWAFVHSLRPPGSPSPEPPEVLQTGLQVPAQRQVQNGIVDFIGVLPGSIVFTDNSSGTSHIAFVRETK